jgi:hypothetical protein
MATYVSIEIAYANLGNVNKPQAQIQQITYNWNDFTDITLRVNLKFKI